MTAMPFAYSKSPHIRKHGPFGYVNYETYKDWLRDEFSFRCVYCLDRERWYPTGHASFGVDHILPKGEAEYANLVCDYDNLLYACNQCNSSKRDELLLNPCADVFGEHLSIGDDGEIVGLTREGKELVDILRLDLRDRTEDRRIHLLIAAMFRRQPDNVEIRDLYLREFGYPDDLPELGALRPRGGNTKPAGIDQTHQRQRQAGNLPIAY
jgi:HNH endonuclease